MAQNGSAAQECGTAERHRPERKPGRGVPGPHSPHHATYFHLCRLGDAVVGVAILLTAFVVTNIGRMPGGLAEFLALRITVKNLLLLAGFTVAWRLVCELLGLYHPRGVDRRRTETVRVLAVCGLASLIALVFPVISVTGAFHYGTVVSFWVGSSVAMLMLRTGARRACTPPVPREALIVGTGPRAVRLYRERHGTEPGAYNVLGFVDSDDQRAPGSHEGRLLGGLQELEAILMRQPIDEVLIALPIKSRYADIQSAIECCERVGVRAKYLAELFDSGRPRFSQVEADRIAIVAPTGSPEGLRLAAKRALDVAGASLALVLLAPVLAAAALAIKLTSRGPVFFAQNRYGMNRRLFKMYKLRTMVADAEARQAELECRNEASGPVFKIREDPRVTPVGRFLRRTSLDELPQFWNVLRGDMSLVGPRPLPTRDVHLFTEGALMRRFSVRPGLTCLWQISGRSNLGFDEWIRLDLKYIDEWSLALDMLILLKTPPAVLKGTGAS